MIKELTPEKVEKLFSELSKDSEGSGHWTLCSYGDQLAMMVSGSRQFARKSFNLFFNYAEAELLHRIDSHRCFIPLTESRLNKALETHFGVELRRNFAEKEYVYDTVEIIHENGEIEFDKQLMDIKLVNEDEIDRVAKELAEKFAKEMEIQSLPFSKNIYQ